jgi:CheY-like chemotaxis protein
VAATRRIICSIAPFMLPTVKWCSLCGHDEIESVVNGRTTLVYCRNCGAVHEVEFVPLDDSAVRDRMTSLAQPAGEPAADRKRQILLVDDDSGFADTLAALLHLEGFAVVTETTVAGAAAYLSDSSPDVLITDIRLKNGDGWALAKYAKRRDPTLKVIVVTGFSAACDEGDAEYWRLPVFLKPFDPDDLLAYIRAVA